MFIKQYCSVTGHFFTNVFLSQYQSAETWYVLLVSTYVLISMQKINEWKAGGRERGGRKGGRQGGLKF
jgi:hypothetical protein